MTRFTPLWLQSGSYAGSVDRRLLGALWPAAASSGMAVTVASGTTVNIAPGSIAVPSVNNTGSVLCASDAQEQVILPTAPASGVSRWDLVIVRPRGTDLDGGGNNDFIFDYVSGAESASPPIPNAPAGTAPLARINRPGGSAAIVPADIIDMRPGLLSLADVMGSASVPLCFRRRNMTSAYSTPNGSSPNVNFQTEDPYSQDPNNLLTWNATTFTFTVNRAGIWHMMCVIGGNWGAAAGRRRIGIMWGVNFLSQQSGQWNQTLPAGMSCHCVLYLPVATPISVQLFQDSGAAQTVGPHSSAVPVFFAMSLVR
jgi:hypothetical protein